MSFAREEQFYLDVPHEVLSLGPWSVISRGEVSELLAEHRLTLARQGYAVIEAHMLGFEKCLKATVSQPGKQRPTIRRASRSRNSPLRPGRQLQARFAAPARTARRAPQAAAAAPRHLRD